MKRRIFSLAMAVCMLLSLAAIVTPAAVAVNEGSWTNWDIEYSGGSMILNWAGMPGSGPYQIARAGARFGTYSPLNGGVAVSGTTFTDPNPNTNKYENYYRITPSGGGSAFLISLEEKVFGPNVRIYDAQYHTGVEAAADINSRDYHVAEMGTQRWAYMFKEGNYNAGRTSTAHYLDIGFYISVYGLGKIPTDTIISSVQCRTNGMGNNATQTFWRSIENVYVQYGISNDGNNCFRWAVSQAAPARRLQFDSAQLDWDNGWCSGGYLADSNILGAHGSASGQQYYYRSNNYNTAPSGFGNWHFTFEGDTGAGVRADSGASWGGGGLRNTVFPTVQGLMREKPFVYLDGDVYKVFVPGWRNNAAGLSWGSGKDNGGMGVGESLDLLDDFYIAYPSNSAEEINDALRAGYNLLLTPGIYILDEPIVVGNANTVVLGLGYATVVPAQSNQWGAMTVMDVEGVVISGVMFDSYYNSTYQLRIGEEGLSEENNLTNPIIMHDVFFRVGGFTNVICTVDVSLQINANGAILDHAWIWRADHGSGWTGWEIANSDYGLWVTGDNVTAHALFNEHYKKYGTYWEGEYGRCYFLQNETPYDPGNNKGRAPNPPGPAQSVYMSHKGTVAGYAQFKVANKVNNFYGAGLGAYACHTQLRNATAGDGLAWCYNAFEVPIKPGVELYHLQNINIGAAGSQFRYMVNGTGPAAAGAGSSAYMTRYPTTPSTATQPPDYADDPDLVAPSYDDRGLDYPPGVLALLEGLQVRLALTNLTRDNVKAELNTDYVNTLYTGTGSNYGYYVPNSIVITANGVPLTSGYTYTPAADRLSATVRINASVLSAANFVDGNLEIVITAAGVADYSDIATVLTNVSYAGPTRLYNNLPVNATLTAAAGYMMPTSITVTGAANYTYTLAADNKSATLVIPAISANVTITAAAVANFATVTYNLTDMIKVKAPDTADLGSALDVSLVATGFNLAPASVAVTMGGTLLTEGVDYSYDVVGTNGGLILVNNVTGNIVITAAAIPDSVVRPAVPAIGRAFYLVALRNNKIVQPAAAPATGTMVANLDAFIARAGLTCTANTNPGLLTGPARPPGSLDCFIVSAANSLRVSLESTDYGDQLVRPRAEGAVWDGWEGLTIIPQADGTVKINRNHTRTSNRWVVVEDDGALMSRGADGGENSKFNWYYTDEQPPERPDFVYRGELYNAIAYAEGLTASDWTAATWAALVPVLASARADYADPAADQSTIDAAAALLWDAINALVYDVDDTPYGIVATNRGTTTPATAMASNWNPLGTPLVIDPNQVIAHGDAGGVFGYGPAAAIDARRGTGDNPVGYQSRWGTRGWGASNAVATYENFEWFDLTMPAGDIFSVSSLDVSWALGYPEFFKIQYLSNDGVTWNDVKGINTDRGTSIWSDGN